jgi:hypothetical protein
MTASFTPSTLRKSSTLRSIGLRMLWLARRIQRRGAATVKGVFARGVFGNLRFNRYG